jgi:two-component system cell cycle response regulator DivK
LHAAEAISERRLRRRVLVVEDNPSTLELYAWCLRAAGWMVVEVPDAEGALAVVGDVRPDAAVVDLRLPGINGTELIRRLRDDPELKHLVIVACTGFDSAAGESLAREAGCDSFLAKPFPPDELRDVLHAFVPAGRR